MQTEIRTQRLNLVGIIQQRNFNTVHLKNDRTRSAVNANIYIGKCLPKLLAFITKHHLDDKYMFWLDLASSHFAKCTTEWLNEQNVPFVPSCINPPNISKARPVEDFRSILTDKVYHGSWIVTNEKQSDNRIKAQLKRLI